MCFLPSATVVSIQSLESKIPVSCFSEGKKENGVSASVHSASSRVLVPEAESSCRALVFRQGFDHKILASLTHWDLKSQFMSLVTHLDPSLS